MRWLYKYRWSFILFYFFPLCWMYKATLSSNFGIQSLINSIVLSNRGLFVVAFSLIGAVMASRSKFSTSAIIALTLSFYMLGVSFVVGDTLNLSLFSTIFFWSVTFCISEQNILSLDDVRIISLIAAIVCNLMAIDIILYYPRLSNMVQLNQDQRVAASNSIYYLMSAFIFIFLVQNDTLKKIFMVLPCIAILLVGKSTCLVAVTASILYYFWRNIVDSTNKSKLIIGALILVGCVSYFSSGFISIFDTIKGFDGDIQSGGNGRFDIWTAVWNKFVSSDLLSMFFGNGSHAVSGILRLGGHNDFVEILYDYGLIGLVIYLLFWYSLIRRVWTYAPKSELQMAYVISLIVFASASMFSNFINTQIQMLYFVMFWGFISVKEENDSLTNISF